MPITIARAKVSDGKAIIELAQRVWREKVSTIYETAILIRLGYAFVAKDRGKIVGSILAMRTVDGCVYVNDWVVDRKYRRLGVGTKLYKRLISTVDGTPIISYVRTDFKESVAAHRKMGFKFVKKVKDPYGIGERVPRYLVRLD